MGSEGRVSPGLAASPVPRATNCDPLDTQKAKTWDGKSQEAMHIDFSRWRSTIGAIQCRKQRWRNEHMDRGFDTRGSTIIPYVRLIELSKSGQCIAMQNAYMFQEFEKHQQ